MHTCSCGKSYKLLRPFQEHRALCEMIKLSNKNQSVEHLTDTPSLIDMWLAMKTLIRRNAALEKEVYGLRNWANVQKKKLSVIDWLNEGIDVMEYSEWIDGIVLDKGDLEMVFEHNFIGGMSHILYRLLPLHDDISLPVKAFDQKLNTLFICRGGSWSAIDKDEFTKLINILHHKLHGVFTIYKKRTGDFSFDQPAFSCFKWNAKSQNRKNSLGIRVLPLQRPLFCFFVIGRDW